MNNKRLSVFMLLFFTINLPGCVSALHVMSSPEVKTAYIAEVYYPKSEIYQARGNVWNFTIDLTVHNADCSGNVLDEASFFFKFYRDEEIWWNEYNDSSYKFWQCNMGGIQRRSYRVLIPTWSGPKNYNFKIELYWYHDDIFDLRDVRCFTVTCMLLLDPQHQFVIGYLSIYSFVIILLSLYLVATGRIKISGKTWESKSSYLDVSKGTLARERVDGGVDAYRSCPIRTGHLRFLPCQMCRYE